MATARVESNEELTTRRAAIMKSFGLPTDASVDEMRQAGRKNVNTTEGILKASVEKGQMTNEDMEARLDIIEDKNDGLEQELLSIDARLTTDQASIVEQKVQTVESMPPVADSAPTEHSLDPIVSEWDDDGSAFYDKTTPSTPAVTKESVTRTTVPSANRAEILGTIATPEQTYAPVAVPPEMEDVYVNKDTAGLAVGFNDGIKTLEDEPSVTGLDDDDFFGIRVDAAEAINKRNEVQTEIKNIRKRLDDLQEQERKIAKEYSGVFKKFTRWLNAEPDKLRGIKRTIETALQSLGKAQRQLEELAAEERGFEDYEQAEKNPEALLADRDFILENDLRFNPSKDAAMFRETHSSASLLEARKKKLVEAFSKTAEDRVMVGPEVYRKNTITIGTRRDVLVAQYRENIQAQIDKIVELEDAADQATLFPPISADDGVRVSRQSPLVASKLKNARSGKTRYLRAVSDQ